MFVRKGPSQSKQSWLIVGLLSPMAVACNLKDTIDYRNTLLRFTDIHVSVEHWDHMPPSAQEHMAEQLPFPDIYDAENTFNELYSSEGIIKEMNAAGVDRGILFATHSPVISGALPLESLHDLIEGGDERLWGLVSVDVNLWATNENNALVNLENGLKADSMIGIALSPAHQRFRMDDPSYWSIYEKAAELNAPIVIKTGKSAFRGALQEAPYTNPIALEEAIKAHPETKFVLSGIGFDETIAAHNGLADCLRMAADYDNVWLEAGIIGSKQFDPNGSVIQQTAKLVKEAGLIDRYLFGSGGPFPSGNVNHTVDSAIEAFMSADYTYDEALAVFSANAEGLFGLSPSVWP